jgi:uncharacterized protein
MTTLDPTLLDILACPCPAHAPLRSDRQGDEEVLVCTSCGLAFPVRDGIPVMLLDEARPFDAALSGSPAGDSPAGV